MARRLIDGVWELDLGLLPPLASNAFLLDEREMDGTDGEAVTLCDTGLFWNEPSIRDELAAVGYEPGDLDRVLLTHYDLDHVGGLERLQPEFTGPVFLGRADYELVENGAPPPSNNHKGLFHRAARTLCPLPDGIDLRPVDDGEAVGQFASYATPGHNPGHTVYVHDCGVALLGDLVWEEGGAMTTPIWFDSYDMDRVRASVREFAARAPAFEVAAMAHGTPFVRDGDDVLGALAATL
ncbi:MBL fold metallo-hydrolase [Halomicrobium mukohataei]|uniref:MBL fold metallo-hydrolase n=1 Tax=Halomicrobium mukohataei TaxID=57705 RepID=A0A847UDC2_9EURY|nr:MBL fold metallo-hydrolase [Halomicrobium mukohataei]NLV10486.1 MBL fold metallo-hydrolase [Halomicrobium mukohataei]